MRVDILTGSRDWKGPVHIIRDALRGCDLLIVGDCPTGADAAAWAYARANDIMVNRFKALDYGTWPSCGPRRNEAMLSRAREYVSDGMHVVGHALWWPGSKCAGTRGAWRLMKLAGVEIVTGAVDPSAVDESKQERLF